MRIAIFTVSAPKPDALKGT